jgi:hypothetical protein
LISQLAECVVYLRCDAGRHRYLLIHRARTADPPVQPVGGTVNLVAGSIVGGVVSVVIALLAFLVPGGFEEEVVPRFVEL